MAFANQLETNGCTCCGGGGGGGGGGTTTYPNCFCMNTPNSLSLRSCNGPQVFGFVQSASLTYSAIEPGAVTAACGFGGPGWWSGPLTTTAPFAGTIYYRLICLYNQWTLTYFQITVPMQCAVDVAYWLTGTPQNTCSPFSLTCVVMNIFPVAPAFACLTVGTGGAPGCSTVAGGLCVPTC